MKNGIFISYKRQNHRHLAGRIYDYFNTKGIAPFIDDQSLHPSEQNHFWDDIEETITHTPYFLCLLSKEGVDDMMSENYLDPNQIFCREIMTALKGKRENSSPKKIIVIADEDVDYKAIKGKLPEELAPLLDITFYDLPKTNRLFFSFMDEIYRNDIDLNNLKGILDWQEYTSRNSNTLVLPRKKLEENNASLNNRFGEDLMESIESGTEFLGQNIVKEVNMLCYAASLIFAPERNMVDRKAYDYGKMFNIFTRLLVDEDFSMRLITVAPDSEAANDAIEYEKLGNSALEDNEGAVFLGSYAKINQLIKQEPYLSALKDRRFSFMVTKCALPYAIFQITYKKGWEKYNHVKVDLYSFGIDSSVERPSMLFFEHDLSQKEGYDFFVKQFEYMRQRCRKNSSQIKRDNHDAWMAQWSELLIDSE